MPLHDDQRMTYTSNEALQRRAYETRAGENRSEHSQGVQRQLLSRIPGTPPDSRTSSGPLNELWFKKDERSQRFLIPMERAWETNDGALSRAWALSGKGIARKTIWDAMDDVRAGRLKLVLSDHRVDEAGGHAIFHGGRYMPARVRALLDFIAEHFARVTKEL